MFFGHNGTKLDINNKRKFEEFYICLEVKQHTSKKNLWVREIIR